MRALVVNYGVGNLFSISSALRRKGLEVDIGTELTNSYDLLVFPGVGAFSAVSKFLNSRRDQLNELKESGSRFFGVCLGMQVMFQSGSEGGRSEGLGWLKGVVDKLVNSPKLPHIGWDRLIETKPSILIEGLEGKYFYFVHSYAAYDVDNDYVRGFSVYGVKFPAVVEKDSLVGTQFHPEKSGASGSLFLDNLMRWLKR
ncbi:imidazole glycerol phosphate synthase subunit HisH [Sulfodiicoccus acidiphilus]|uniref:Imidazole glycerol phosphate synthase subunit HisH n=1 Tax=Sulfodiicoccus acidiphilus TaxID=1670455 RepID=A0A348B726_9CREN|nr:imidazole glycerol phosphate synthase subunit HisH [Sulfodiicoccus acidiphilus]BBD73978.1 imidazole glycerol phosphate synthase subunit HisH [Sulfodiicoccus acidiphilus]GGU02683.1 imidazole glycerol phosphate synthase subunit HisH [Sulfodiicoccus acidiphilus]